MDLNDDQIEATVRDLIAEHLTGEARRAALDWLKKRVATYRTIQSLSDDD